VLREVPRSGVRAGGVEAFDLTEALARGSQVGGVQRARFVVVGQVAELLASAAHSTTANAESGRRSIRARLHSSAAAGAATSARRASASSRRFITSPGSG